MSEPPDYSDPLHGITGQTPLPRRPVAGRAEPWEGSVAGRAEPWEGSVVASAPVVGGVAVPDEPVPYRDYPGRMYGRTPPTDAYPDPPSANAPWPLVAGEAPRPRRRVLGILLACGLLVVLGVGIAGAWLVIGPGMRGDDSPEAAVNGFLTGIYETRDAHDAGRHVCERARDDAELGRIVFTVRQQQEAFTAARTTWNPPTIHVDGREATAEVTLTMATLNEQVSTRTITLQLVDDRGWWVCDVL